MPALAMMGKLLWPLIKFSKGVAVAYPYRLPVFNLTLSGWTTPLGPSVVGPDVFDLPCQLYLNTRQMAPVDSNDLSDYFPPIGFRYPIGAGVGRLYWIECPVGSGVYYRVRWSHEAHKGFPNAYWEAIADMVCATGVPQVYPGATDGCGGGAGPNHTGESVGGIVVAVGCVGNGVVAGSSAHTGVGVGEIEIVVSVEGVGVKNAGESGFDETGPFESEWEVPFDGEYEIEVWGCDGNGIVYDGNPLRGGGGGGGGGWGIAVRTLAAGDVYSVEIPVGGTETNTMFELLGGGGTAVWGEHGNNSLTGEGGAPGGAGGCDSFHVGGWGGDGARELGEFIEGGGGGGGGSRATAAGDGSAGANGAGGVGGTGAADAGDGGNGTLEGSATNGGNGTLGGGGGPGGGIDIVGGEGGSGRMKVTFLG